MSWSEPILESIGSALSNVLNENATSWSGPTEGASKSLKVQRMIQEEYLRVMHQVDFLVTPTAPVPAPRIDATHVNINGEDHRVRGPGSGFISRNTSPLNTVGLPAISVPCGVNYAGLPIGVQFITAPFEEGLLFQVADSYEKISPSQRLRPDISVGV